MIPLEEVDKGKQTEISRKKLSELSLKYLTENGIDKDCIYQKPLLKNYLIFLPPSEEESQARIFGQFTCFLLLQHCKWGKEVF